MRLLESQTERERRGGGTMTSVVVHVAIIVAAIGAGARTPPEPQIIEVDYPLVYEAPPPDVMPLRPGTTGSSTTGSPSTPTRTIAVPDEVPVGIPDIPIDVQIASPGAKIVLGGNAGEVREGGFSTGQGYGAPDANGTWNAHTVEVGVVPDARNPVPSYPETLRSARITGRVLVEFVVDSTGRVREGSLAIIESDHPLFASSVRRTIPSFRFTPARVQGRRVAQRVRVPFEFDIRD